MADKHLNCRAMQCPGPIMQVFTMVKQMEAGEVLTVEVTDHGFKKDIEAWCKKTKNELISLDEIDGAIIAKIKKL